MAQLKKHRTTIVFTTCVVLSLLSLGLAFVWGPWFIILIGVSVLFNVWALVVSERHGFVKTNQIRRAFEPNRHFNAAQVFIVSATIMIQLLGSAFILLRS